MYTTVAVALLYTLVGAVYYLKVMKVCYVDNPSSWRTYGKTNSITAYTVAVVVRLMMIGLWCGNVMFLYTHLAGLRASCSTQPSSSL
jgi:NADH:ubiquinone oxidoreductase subunit 2 (subunit N)